MPSPIPLAAQIACVQREITMRLHVYPGLGRLGRMTQAQRNHEVACLQAVLAKLEYLARLGQVDLFAPREDSPQCAADEPDGPWPDVIDQCPCPDCTTPLLWTRLDDVRTAWQVHHCPPREEPTP